MTEPSAGIGTLHEGALHAAIKRWYAAPGDELEARVAGYVVDLLRGDLIIEIQTGAFYRVRPKLQALLASHRLRLVYPIAEEKWIVQLSPEGERLSRRRSPKHGRLADLFEQLVYLPELMADPGFELQVLLVRVEELRCRDGRGSWRRQGASILARELVAVTDECTFATAADLRALVPAELAEPFTNRELAASLKLRLSLARRMTHCLANVGALARVGRRGHELLYAR